MYFQGQLWHLLRRALCKHSLWQSCWCWLGGRKSSLALYETQFGFYSGRIRYRIKSPQQERCNTEELSYLEALTSGVVLATRDEQYELSFGPYSISFQLLLPTFKNCGLCFFLKLFYFDRVLKKALMFVI